MKKALKIIFIVIGVIIGGLTALIIGLVVNDLRIESKLNKIVENFSNQEVINMNIETSGDYAKVERAIKNDYNDFYKLVDKTINEYGNPIITKCLSAKNYEKDGPEFINTRVELEQLKTNRKEINNKMLEIVSSESISSKIKKYKFDDYYAELYTQYINDLRILINDVIKEDEDFNETIAAVVQILDFLKNEKDHWMIEGENIVFDDQDLLDKYSWLVDKICEYCNNEELPNV